MKLFRTFVLIPVLIFTFASCSMARRIVVQQSVPVFDEGIKVFMAEEDLTLANQSLSALIKVIEVLLTQDPENVEVLSFLAQAYGGYTQAFVEDPAQDFRFKNDAMYREQMQRAKLFYLRGFEFGKKAINVDAGENVFIDEETGNTKNLEEFKTWLKEDIDDEDDVPMVFWTAMNWLSAMNTDREDLELFSRAAYAVAMIERCVELDEKYFYGMPHLLLAGYYSGLPALYGDNKAKALGHFKKVNEINEDKFLLSMAIQAEYLSVQYQDEKMYDRMIDHIQKADPYVYPEINMLNRLAIRKAGRLKGLKKEYF